MNEVPPPTPYKQGMEGQAFNPSTGEAKKKKKRLVNQEFKVIPRYIKICIVGGQFEACVALS